jgi:hypothetical protein
MYRCNEDTRFYFNVFGDGVHLMKRKETYLLISLIYVVRIASQQQMCICNDKFTFVINRHRDLRGFHRGANFNCELVVCDNMSCRW